MELRAFISLGIMVTLTIILINLLSVLCAKADKQDDWFLMPLVQNTILAIVATTLLVAYSVGLL